MLYKPESVQVVCRDLRTNLPAVTGERFDSYLRYNKNNNNRGQFGEGSTPYLLIIYWSTCVPKLLLSKMHNRFEYHR